MNLDQLAERLAKDERVGAVTVAVTRTIVALDGHEPAEKVETTVHLMRRGSDDQSLDPAFLRLGTGEAVIGATLNVSAPFWAVEAVRRALEIDP